jgi:hypothetical protein
MFNELNNIIIDFRENKAGEWISRAEEIRFGHVYQIEEWWKCELCERISHLLIIEAAIL